MKKNEDINNLIDGCKKGDKQCFSELIKLYSPRIYGYFYRQTGRKSVSEDLLSELFVKLVRKIGSFKGDNFDGWIFRVSANIFYDYLRAKQKQQRLIEQQQREFREPRGVRSSDEEYFDILQKELNGLDEDTRNIIVLKYYSGLSFKEIAEMRGEPIGTTLSKAHRGIKKLRELMVK